MKLAIPNQNKLLQKAQSALGNCAPLIGLDRIQAYCDAMAREFQPEKIVLFGSYAYGDPTPDSDVDLLVILPFRGSDVTKAMQIRSRFDTPFPLDLMVRKPEFVSSRLQERDMFIEWVMHAGRVMYESQHA
jgi:predicted nucleotidyltransferase